MQSGSHLDACKCKNWLRLATSIAIIPTLLLKTWQREPKRHEIVMLLQPCKHEDTSKLTPLTRSQSHRQDCSRLACGREYCRLAYVNDWLSANKTVVFSVVERSEIEVSLHPAVEEDATENTVEANRTWYTDCSKSSDFVFENNVYVGNPCSIEF